MIDSNSFYTPPLLTANSSFSADQFSFFQWFLQVSDSNSFYPPPLLTANNGFTAYQVSLFPTDFYKWLTLIVSILHRYLQLIIVSQLLRSLFPTAFLLVIDSDSFYPPPLVTTYNSFTAVKVSFSHCFLQGIYTNSFYPLQLLTANNSFTVGQLSFSHSFLQAINSNSFYPPLLPTANNSFTAV
jgi:hypothetical protein